MFPILLAAAFLATSPPDTLAPASVSAALHISPATESVRGERLREAPSAADAIRDFSGIQLRDYGGVGGLKTVNVRSLGSAHTAIFLDGVPIDNAQNMQVDLGRIDPDELESIELYAGQKSELLQSAREYGSASSLHLRSALPVRRFFRARLRGGAFGSISPYLSAETRRGAFAGRLSLRFDQANGQYPFHDKGPGYDTLMIRQNCDLKAFKADARLWFLPSGGRYELHAGWYDADRGIPGPVYRQAGKYPLSSDRQGDRSLTVQASGEQQLGQAWKLLMRLKYSRDWLDYWDVSELDPSVSAQWNYLLQSAYLSGSLGWRAAPWLHLNAAVDLQHDWLEARVSGSRRQVVSAASAALLMDPWRVSASLQFQHSSDGYTFWSPAVLVDWHPREDWEFGALVKRSCRLPSFNDLYYTNVGTRELKPECVWQTALRWCWDRQYTHWHFRLREELYFNLVQDKLIAVPNGSLFRWSMYNIGMVHIYGDELSAEVAWKGREWLFGLTARYTFQRAFDPADGWQIPYIPLHGASFNFQAGWKTLELIIRGFLTGDRYTARSTRPEYHLTPWTTWDLSLSWKPLPLLRLGLELRNLFNEQYEIVKQYPMPGIHVLGSVAISF
ncbi:MAG: TonB-dependent receptor [Bacteroidales bacterium]|nr:TonB-dependent receptor [Bacteroidales bacterium]